MPIIRLFHSLIAVLVLVSCLAAAAQDDGSHAEVELVSERGLAVAGETVWLGLSFELDDGWHIYWKNAGDAGLPPEIAWTKTSGIEPSDIGGFSWPVPELLPVVPDEIMDYGYSDAVTLPFTVKIPEDAAGPLVFEGVADYLICKDICIPESASIRLIQSVGAEQFPDAYGSDLISAAIAAMPKPFEGEATLSQQDERWTLSLRGADVAGLSGDARFFPAGHEIRHASAQPVRFGPDGLQIDLTPSGSGDLPDTIEGVVVAGDVAVELTAAPGALLGDMQSAPEFGPPVNLPLLIVLAVIGGLILNLMPCVLPVLSIKAMGIVSASANGQASEARAHGLWYTAGVLLCFAALAAMIVAVRAATGIATWGFWLQDPLIVTALILIIFLIGLWLLGMFELGSSVQNVGGELAAKQGSAGAFFTGVLAAIVGAPCTGPFLGAALGAIMTRPSIEIFIVLLAMGLGMALPFLALSFMPGLQKRIPKPGAWMETLKQVFAFPMFLTAAWLLSVLGALAGYRMAASVVAGAALIGFGIWALKSAGQGGKSILIALLGLLCIIPVFGLMGALSSTSIEVWPLLRSLGMLIGMVTAIWVVAQLSSDRAGLIAKLVGIVVAVAGLTLPLIQSRTAQASTGEAADSYSAAYPTEAWSPDRVRELTAEGRAVFIDFTAEWCATCQANKLQTLKTQAVTEAFEAGDVAFLVADYTRPNAEIAAELRRHNRAGVPLYLWYAPGSAEPQVLPEVLSVEMVTGLVAAAG